MSRYMIQVPIDGAIDVVVEADSLEEAKVKALKMAQVDYEGEIEGWEC